MTLKTTPFDAAKYLRTPEAIAAYLNEALNDGDPELIARALDTIARAPGLNATSDSAPGQRDDIGAARDFDAVRRVLNTLGLRLQVATA